jgi:WD domain, G-beta repeat
MRRLVPDWQTLCSTGAVIGALFSPDGTRVVTASTDKTAHVWDAATGAWLGKPMQHPNIVNSAAFSRDGERAVIASADNTAGWDAVIRAPIGQPLPHEDCVISEVQPPRDAVGNRFIRREKLGTRRNVREMARAGRGTIPRA